MKNLFKIFGRGSEKKNDKKRKTLESGRLSSVSDHSEKSDEDSTDQNDTRVLHSNWPMFDLVEWDFADYDDDVSIVSLDMSIWKSAPTDNEVMK